MVSVVEVGPVASCSPDYEGIAGIVDVQVGSRQSCQSEMAVFVECTRCPLDTFLVLAWQQILVGSPSGSSDRYWQAGVISPRLRHDKSRSVAAALMGLSWADWDMKSHLGQMARRNRCEMGKMEEAYQNYKH